MLSTAIILPGDTELFPFNSFRTIDGVEWDGIFFSGKRQHPSFDRSLIYSSPEIIPLICDLLIVVDPQFCTFEYLSFAIRNGCHLFLADKLCLTSEERKQLFLLANEGDTYIRIQNDLLFHPFQEKIRIASPQTAFTEVSQPLPISRELTDQLLNENLLMILRAVGSKVQEVDVFCGILPLGESPVITIPLNFKNGSVVTLKLKFSEPEAGHVLSIHSGAEITVYDFGQNTINYISENGINTSEQGVSFNPLADQIAEFVRNITEKNYPGINQSEEMTLFLLMEKIRQKIENQLNYNRLVS